MKLNDLFDGHEDGPLYDHDCRQCVYLGTEPPEPGDPRVNGVDLYVCVGPRTISLIRRWGSDRASYGSTPVSLNRLTGEIRTMTGEPLSPRYQRILDRAKAEDLLPTLRPGNQF